MQDVITASRVSTPGAEWAMARTTGGLRLLLSTGRDARVLDELDGEATAEHDRVLLSGPLSPRNAAAVRRHLPWLEPRPIGAAGSAGFGDRLGRATPGHVRAIRAAGSTLVPVFAQQSIREMARTGRSPQEVVDAATWGALAEGWRGAVGADADHLKTTADIDACLGAGFTLFTIDPGEHVDAGADHSVADEVYRTVESLPWQVLEDDARACRARYVGRTFDLEQVSISFDEERFARAAAKYGRAVAHVVGMYRHLSGRAAPGTFELEVSVDETESPTSPAEHVFVATEMRRLGVRWVSLAPRFVGRFEKGVDYIGDVEAFERDVAAHASIARALGPYKLSLHSGSDKFSIYPAVARQTRGLVHLKTAGTSYLEALRTLAVAAPPLLREIYRFARDRYADDRASYHVSAEVGRAPDADALEDAALATLLDDFDAREVLHVTYGSVLTARDATGAPRFADRIASLLESSHETYARCLETHFVRHLAPFERR